MEIDVKKLILHSYSEAELMNQCSPNTLKDSNIEWDEDEHKNHKYANEIRNSDIVFNIKHISTNEEYGYFFFKAEKAPMGNYVYMLQKAIVDANMSDTYLVHIVKCIVELLNNGNYLRNDRLIAKGNYPLTEHQLQNTIDCVSNEILSLFRSKKSGLSELPQEFVEKLSDMAKRMNAPK